MGSVLRDGRDEGRFTLDQEFWFYSKILGAYWELFKGGYWEVKESSCGEVIGMLS